MLHCLNPKFSLLKPNFPGSTPPQATKSNLFLVETHGEADSFWTQF